MVIDEAGALGLPVTTKCPRVGCLVIRGLDMVSAVDSGNRPQRRVSAITSFSFFPCCAARIFTSRIRSSGKSKVVFTPEYSHKNGFVSKAKAGLGRWLRVSPRCHPRGDVGTWQRGRVRQNALGAASPQGRAQVGGGAAGAGGRLGDEGEVIVF